MKTRGIIRLESTTKFFLIASPASPRGRCLSRKFSLFLSSPTPRRDCIFNNILLNYVCDPLIKARRCFLASTLLAFFHPYHLLASSRRASAFFFFFIATLPSRYRPMKRRALISPGLIDHRFDVPALITILPFGETIQV